MKKCSVCNEEKELSTENFHRMSSSKDGFRSECKECRKDYAYRSREHISRKRKQYYQKNKEKENEYRKEYYQKNKEKELIKAHQYNKENAGKVKEYQKMYREENREILRERQRVWSKENPEYIKEYDLNNKHKRKRYMEENAHIFKHAREVRRAMKKQLPYTLTLEEWDEIKRYFNNKCSYCGMSEDDCRESWDESLHRDHFIPISKGGGYTRKNIVPACRSCNSSKKDSLFNDWYPCYEKYNEERESKIRKFLNEV